MTNDAPSAPRPSGTSVWPSPLISVAELSAALSSTSVVLVDCQNDLFDSSLGRQRYLAGHLPGAFHLALEHDLSDSDAGLCGGRHPLPAREHLRARLAALGLTDDSLLVAYDADGGSWAARLWWLAQWLGHERVAVLDGGLAAWQAAGQSLVTGAPDPTPVEAVASAALRLRTPLVAWINAKQLEERRAAGPATLVDARAPARYRGDQEPIDPVAGHIPGALNRFWQQNLEADGHFRSPAALRAEFEGLLGGARADQAIHYCGSGVSACHNLLAMAHAGLDGSLLYPGSWSEWCRDPARPVARGTA